MADKIQTGPLPHEALLRRYDDAVSYTDCFVTTVAGDIDLASFVAAFYCTPLFKTERWILRVAVARPSSDAQAAELGRGERDAFAAWTVEDRRVDQLLMCDFQSRTRSWFMVEPAVQGTRLFFGSAVVARQDPETGRASLGAGFRFLLGFHKLYSRLLLAAAARRLR